MLGGANKLCAGRADVNVSVGEISEVIDAEEPGVVALSLLVQSAHDASGFAFPKPCLGAVAAVADQLARRPPQVHLALVQHPSAEARIRVTSRTDVHRR